MLTIGGSKLVSHNAERELRDSTIGNDVVGPCSFFPFSSPEKLSGKMENRI